MNDQTLLMEKVPKENFVVPENVSVRSRKFNNPVPKMPSPALRKGMLTARGKATGMVGNEKPPVRL